MRGAFITRLANDLSISLKEVMVAACHNTASASATYQRSSVESGSNRIVALMKMCQSSEPNCAAADATDGKIVEDEKVKADDVSNLTAVNEMCEKTWGKNPPVVDSPTVVALKKKAGISSSITAAHKYDDSFSPPVPPVVKQNHATSPHSKNSLDGSQ